MMMVVTMMPVMVRRRERGRGGKEHQNGKDTE
jgi:hypothetical protein